METIQFRYPDLLFHFIVLLWYTQSHAADGCRFHFSLLTLSCKSPAISCLHFCIKVTLIIFYGCARSAISRWSYPVCIPFLLLHLCWIFFVRILNSYFLGEGSYSIKSICVTMWDLGYLPLCTKWKPHSHSLSVTVFPCYTQTAVKYYL